MAQTYTIAVFEEVLHNCFPHLEDRVSVYAKENGGPLDRRHPRQDIRAYAAWSVFKYDRGNFADYPGLQDFCCGFRPSQKIDGIAYYKQLLLKVYSTCISSPSCR